MGTETQKPGKHETQRPDPRQGGNTLEKRADDAGVGREPKGKERQGEPGRETVRPEEEEGLDKEPRKAGEEERGRDLNRQQNR